MLCSSTIWDIGGSMLKKLIGLFTLFFWLALTSPVSFAFETNAQNEKIISDATALIEKNPKDAIAYYKRGIGYLNKNDLDAAMENFNKAIELNPKHAAAFLERGYIYAVKLNQHEQAISDFSEAIKADPKYELAFVNRGISYRKTNQFQLALDDFNKAIKMNRYAAKAYYNKGLTYEETGSYEDAIATYKTLIQVISPQAVDWIRLAKDRLRVLGVN